MKTLNKILIAIALLIGSQLQAQVGIGTSSPNAAAKLDVSSASKGFLMPRLTIAQKSSMTPATGMQVFCTDCGPAGELQVYNGTAWTNMIGGTAAGAFTCGTSTVTHIYNGASVTYGTVSKTYSGVTKCWLDRNLGATRVATSSTDAASFGHYFQWGRGDDGHQLTSSTITSTPIVFGTASSDWVRGSTNPSNWLTVNNNTLWQGAGGPNNPCPAGFRVPTKVELTYEINSWSPVGSTSGAFNSTLKFPATGFRMRAFSTLVIGNINSSVTLWSSTVGNNTNEIWNWDGAQWYSNIGRNEGFMVRCIKD